MTYAKDYNRYVGLLEKTYDLAMGVPLAGLSAEDAAKIKAFQFDAKTSKEVARENGQKLVEMYDHADPGQKAEIEQTLANLIGGCQFALDQLQKSFPNR